MRGEHTPGVGLSQGSAGCFGSFGDPHGFWRGDLAGWHGANSRPSRLQQTPRRRATSSSICSPSRTNRRRRRVVHQDAGRVPAQSRKEAGSRGACPNATRVEPYSKSLPLPNAIPWPTIVPSVSAIANQPRSTTEGREASPRSEYRPRARRSLESTWIILAAWRDSAAEIPRDSPRHLVWCKTVVIPGPQGTQAWHRLGDIGLLCVRSE